MIKIVFKTAPLNERCRRSFMNEATWSNIIWRLMISVQEKENPSNNNTFTHLISLKHTLGSLLTLLLTSVVLVSQLDYCFMKCMCCCAECACTPSLTLITYLYNIYLKQLYKRTCIYDVPQLQTSCFVS